MSRTKQSQNIQLLLEFMDEKYTDKKMVLISCKLSNKLDHSLIQSSKCNLSSGFLILYSFLQQTEEAILISYEQNRMKAISSLFFSNDKPFIGCLCNLTLNINIVDNGISIQLDVKSTNCNFDMKTLAMNHSQL